MDSKNEGTIRRAPRFWRKFRFVAFTVCLVAVAPCLLFVGCQSRIIYFPRPYPPGHTERWQKTTHGKLVTVETSQGKQTGYLQGRLSAPRRLWIVCGGNGTVALDWSEWMQDHAPREDAFLLVDFPGYGANEGRPSPGGIRESLGKMIPAASLALGWPEKPEPAKLRIFGHSLGAAATLIAAADHGIQRGVILSPFTSTMQMARVMTGLPVGFLVVHRFDNEARLRQIAARGTGKIVLFHGSQDEAIPVEMGRELGTNFAGLIEYREIPGAHHNDMPETHPGVISAAMRRVAE